MRLYLVNMSIVPVVPFIVVSPSLSLHRCGLPPEIVIELFQIFVIHGLIRQHLPLIIGVDNSKIRKKEPIVWKILQEVL